LTPPEVTSYLDSVTNGVRQLRESRGLSQGQLAQDLRVSRQTVNAIETGRYLPSLPLAFAIARFFGRPIEEIFHDDEHV
jgi:putative transcriptional regulator